MSTTVTTTQTIDQSRTTEFAPRVIGFVGYFAAFLNAISWVSLTLGRGIGFAGRGVYPFPMPIEALPGVAAAKSLDGVPLVITDMPLWLRLFATSSHLVTAVLFVIATRAALRLLRLIAVGEPFTDEASAVAWRASKAVLASFLLSVALNWSSAQVVLTWLRDQTTLAGAGVTTNASMPTLVLAMVGMALAKALDAGRDLQDDVDGLV